MRVSEYIRSDVPDDAAPTAGYQFRNQQYLLQTITKHPNLTHGGLLFGKYSESSYLPTATFATEMLNMNIAFMAHMWKLPWPKEVLSVPDFHSVRTHNFEKLTALFDEHTQATKFADRIPKLFWRGSATSPNFGDVEALRALMCIEAKKSPHIDAGIIKAFNIPSKRYYAQQDILRDAIHEVDWAQYRGIIAIDGSFNPWGLRWQLATGSVVFKFESNWTNDYSAMMVPWVHFIPLKEDFSDLHDLAQLVTLEPGQSMEVNGKLWTVEALEKIAISARALLRNFTWSEDLERIATSLSNVWKGNRAEPAKFGSDDVRSKNKNDEMIATTKLSASSPTSPTTSTSSSSPRPAMSPSSSLGAAIITDEDGEQPVDHPVTVLLARLADPIRDMQSRFPSYPRFDEVDFRRHFAYPIRAMIEHGGRPPPNHCTFPAGVGTESDDGTNVNRLARGDCKILNQVPTMPTLKRFYDTEALTFFDNMTSAFSAANVNYFDDALKAEYHHSDKCNFASYTTASASAQRPSRSEVGERVSSTFNRCAWDGSKSNYSSDNIILTMAEGYSCNKVSLFLKSLRDSGSCAHVVIFASNVENRNCAYVESSCGHVTVETSDGFKAVHGEIGRTILALQYLVKHAQHYIPRCAQVL